MKTVIRKMQETAAESGLWERLRREGWNITEELESVQKSHSRSNGDVYKRQQNPLKKMHKIMKKHLQFKKTGVII